MPKFKREYPTDGNTGEPTDYGKSLTIQGMALETDQLIAKYQNGSLVERSQVFYNEIVDFDKMIPYLRPGIDLTDVSQFAEVINELKGQIKTWEEQNKPPEKTIEEVKND